MPKLKQFRESFRSFLLNRLQRGWVESQNLENGRSNLHGGDRDGYSISSETRIRNQHHDVGVVVGEAAVLSQFLGAAGIGNSDTRSTTACMPSMLKSRTCLMLPEPTVFLSLLFLSAAFL